MRARPVLFLFFTLDGSFRRAVEREVAANRGRGFDSIMHTACFIDGVHAVPIGICPATWQPPPFPATWDQPIFQTLEGPSNACTNMISLGRTALHVGWRGPDTNSVHICFYNRTPNPKTSHTQPSPINLCCLSVPQCCTT